MASLAAVIAHDPRAPVPPEALGGLLDALRALRGEGEVHRERVGRWAHAALIDGGAPGHRGTGEAGWHLAVGAAPLGPPLWQAPLADLDGVFAAVRHCARRDEVEVLTDPFGLQALYVSSRGDLTYVCTSSLALARHLAAEPDPVGAALFLRTGVHYGPVTHWQGVERVEPGTVMSFGPAGRRVATYWRPTVDESVRGLSLRATVDRLAEATVDMVDPLAAEPSLSADLTGGFDTRLVCAGLVHERIPFTSHTTGEDTDLDVRIARRVAAAAGVPWRRDAVGGGWSLDPSRLASAVAWGDGALDALQLGHVLDGHRERARRCGVVVAGVGGEHLSPFPWLQEFLRAGRTTRIDWDNLVRMRLLLPVELSMFRRDPSAEAERYARDVLGARAALYAGELNTTRLDALYAYRLPSHSGAYRSAAEAHLRLETPCHSKAFFTLGFSANFRWRNGSRLHRGVIERLSPPIADLPTQRGGPAVTTRPANVLRFSPYYARLVRSAVRKYRGIPGAPHESSPAVEAGHRAVVRRLQEAGTLRAGTMRTGGLYDPAALDAFVARSQSAGFDGWSMLGRIATLELALRAADPGTAVPALAA